MGVSGMGFDRSEPVLGSSRAPSIDSDVVIWMGVRLGPGMRALR